MGRAGVGALGALSDRSVETLLARVLAGTWNQLWCAWGPLCPCFGDAPEGKWGGYLRCVGVKGVRGALKNWLGVSGYGLV